MTYADTGFLGSLFFSEGTSAAAMTTVAGLDEVISITWLTKLELENAFLRGVFQGRISSAEAARLWSNFEADIANGIYCEMDIDHKAMATEASRLARHFTPTIGTRTLDLMHVAAASLMSGRRFLSFDNRQRNVAHSLGLQVLPT